MGHLGRVILIPISESQMELRSEMKEKDKGNMVKAGLFKETVDTISKALESRDLETLHKLKRLFRLSVPLLHRPHFHAPCCWYA